MHLDDADFVIVGTGAGGATAARVLSAAGASVVMLEEGPDLRFEERPADLLTAMCATVRDMGAQATTGTRPILLLQGRVVGGSTAINSGIIWEMPDDVRADWIRNHGLTGLVDEQAQARIYSIIENELQIAETSGEVRGGNSHKMEDACRALGLPGRPIVRNARNCQGSARCLQGCPTGARQSMDVSYVPRAIADGARLHALCRVTRVLFRRGRAVGVTGHRLDSAGRKTGTFEVHARKGVIIAAGALHTPVILRRSGLKGLVGERFQAHPGCAIVGRFPESVTMAYGASQGYEVPMRAQGFKIESLSMPPEMLATRIPGAGAEWQERLLELDHYAQWAVQIRMKAHGRVRPSLLGGRPAVRYEPLESDVAVAQGAVALMCRMMFAAGATEVYPGIVHAPEVLTDEGQVSALEDTTFRRSDFHFLASHLFGTACAGTERARSVVGENLECHEAPGLFVMDASVFPTNMGVNPQHSIMTVVWRAAEWLANAGSATSSSRAA